MYTFAADVDFLEPTLGAQLLCQSCMREPQRREHMYSSWRAMSNEFALDATQLDRYIPRYQLAEHFHLNGLNF